MSTSMGLNLSGFAYVPTTAATFPPQPVPRNPTVAFFLSLLLPGLGQFYCRKNARGIWTLCFFLISLTVTIGLIPSLSGSGAGGILFIWSVLLRIALFLYGFAFLDAYFTAREMTAGTDHYIVESPRVAAILNLLTRGFGYFYLGQRAAGFAVFIGLGIFQQAIITTLTSGKEAAGPLILEVILAGLGVHAYTIGRKREKEILATIQPPPQFSAIGGLPPAIPVGLGVLLAAAYLALCCIGFLLPDYSVINQSLARISQNDQATVYANPAYGVEFKASPAWSLENQVADHLVVARRNDHVCAADFRLAAWSPLLSLDSYAKALSAQIERPEHRGSRLVQSLPTTLAGLPARKIVLSLQQQGLLLTETKIAARKGMTLYILTTDSLADSVTDCQSDFQFLQQNLSLTK